jgi:hypothetical protein
MIRVAYSRCYVAPAAYTCQVTSQNSRRVVADGVLCESAPKLYGSTDRILFRECSALQLRFQLPSVNQRATEAKESSISKIRYQEMSS